MWKSIWDIVEVIKDEKYVFLRNAENLKDDFSEKDDWDILCADLKQFINRVKAVPLNKKERCYNYYTVVNEKKLLLDIRCVGDGYYDSKWEINMLETREEKDGYFILDNEQQKYSILYHYLLQKNTETDLKYKKYIQQNFGIFDLKKNLQQLYAYMKKNGYVYVMPLDDNVYLNTENIKLLKEDEMNGRENKKYRRI